MTATPTQSTQNARVAPEAETPEPFSASFHGLPASHDGTEFTFELRLSEDVIGLSYVTVRDSLVRAQGATITRAPRMKQGSNRNWRIHVVPDGGGAVMLWVAPSASCDDADAVCTDDGRGLAIVPAALVPGTTVAAKAQDDASAIADGDGLDNAVFSYRWLADDAAIAGATGSTYTLADGDVGKAIKVRVSFTDDAGNAESLTSEATASVAAAPEPEPEPTPEPEPAPTPEPTLNGMAAPANLTVEVRKNRPGRGSPQIVTLAWDDPKNPDITGYELRVKLESASEWEDWWLYPSTGSSTTSVKFGFLEEGANYRVQLRPVDDGKPGLASEVSFTTPSAD